MLSPASQSAAIEGEANIGRYLARIFPALSYENCNGGDVNSSAQLDQLLDLTDAAGPLGAGGSKRDRPAALQSIEKSLAAGGNFLNGSARAGMVDAVVWSSLTNAKIDAASKEIGKLTSAWIVRCQSDAVN